ncbi:hypothetical protein LG634_15565 [Streptomyces bambusae]|uniref:hypothetical protein n=1 Tax=Streptomyces bambusae TaxID=1550616 RepID=UPI001CFD5DCD|nr:hypothetical protein [Streptomyces bambusae]MCB5166247.1 hypothetical protein [Streptomyces bambusae]
MKKISLLTAAAATTAALGLAAPYSQAAPGATAAPRELRLTAAAELALPVYSGSPAPLSKEFTVNLRARTPGNTAPLKRKVVLDFTSLKGKADWGVGSRDCLRSGNTAVCEAADAIRTGRAVTSVWIRAVKGVKSGASGEVRVTATAAGATVTPWTVKIRVGGPDLKVSRGALPAQSEPGATVPLPVGVTNKGTEPARSLLVWLRTTNGLDFAKQYGNCAYGVHPDRKAALCRIPAAIPVGTTWRLAEAPTVKANPQAGGERIDYGVFADTSATRSRLRKGGTWTQGTGPDLKLTKVLAAPLLVDLEEADNWTSARLNVVRPAEFTAVGGAVRAGAGQTVDASFGFDFKGPAKSSTDEDFELVTRITLPAGVRAVAVPAECRPAGQRGATAYLCVQSPRTYTAGDKARYAFRLTVDRPAAGATGEAWLYRQHHTENPDVPQPGPQRPAGDTNAADDRAAITVAAP